MDFDEKKMMLELHKIKLSEISQQTQTQIQTTTMKFILFGSVVIGSFVRSLPCEKVDGNLVPTLLFKGRPSMFRGLVISVIFSFTGAFFAVLMRNKYSRFAKFNRCYSTFSFAVALSILVYALLLDNSFRRWVSLRCYAMISLASALSILVYALFLDSFCWFSQGKQIMAAWG